MRKSRVLTTLSRAYLLAFWLAGNIAIIYFITHFLPNWASIFYILIPSLSGCALLYSLRPDYERREEELSRLRSDFTKMEEAVCDAVECNTTAPLIPLCDPSWLKYIKKHSPFWHEDRLRTVYLDLKRRSPFSLEVIDKLDPYTNSPIKAEADYEKYLLRLAEDTLSKIEKE